MKELFVHSSTSRQSSKGNACVYIYIYINNIFKKLFFNFSSPACACTIFRKYPSNVPKFIFRNILRNIMISIENPTFVDSDSYDGTYKTFIYITAYEGHYFKHYFLHVIMFLI